MNSSIDVARKFCHTTKKTTHRFSMKRKKTVIVLSELLNQAICCCFFRQFKSTKIRVIPEQVTTEMNFFLLSLFLSMIKREQNGCLHRKHRADVS